MARFVIHIVDWPFACPPACWFLGYCRIGLLLRESTLHIPSHETLANWGSNRIIVSVIVIVVIYAAADVDADAAHAAAAADEATDAAHEMCTAIILSIETH